MKKRILCLLLTAATAATLASGCQGGGSASSSAAASSKAAAGKTTIHVLMGSPEITDAVNTAIKQYKKVKPDVTIQLQVVQSDLPTLLKSKISAGTVPDVFQTTNGPELKEYAGYSADLTDTAAAKNLTDTIKKSMSYNNQVLGLPLKVDVFGIIYDEDVFKKAGVTSTPATLSALETACGKIQKVGVTPFGNGYKEWWVYKHILQQFIGAATTDVGGVVNKFIAGKTTFARNTPMMNYFKFIDLTVKYGQSKPLERDYNGEVSALGGGKVAMITGQGEWAEANILKINPKIKLGFMAYPVSENSKQAGLCEGAGQCLRVSKDSSVKDQSIAFFDWLFTSDYGVKTWFPKVAQLIAPLKNAVPPAGVTIPTQFAKLEKAGVPVYDSAINYSDDSFHQKLGEIMQGYVAKSTTEASAVSQIQTNWKKLGG